MSSDYDLYDVCFADALFGCAVGYNLSSRWAAILSTSDGGESWNAQDMTSRYPLMRVDFSDPGRGWAVGANGTIFRYSAPFFTPGLSDALQPLHFALSAYPNPFNASATLSLLVPARQRVRLGIFDVTGRWVCTLADGLLEAGPQELRFDASALPSGVYFARLNAGSVAVTQKLVLLK
jgi:hypothetical protein